MNRLLVLAFIFNAHMVSAQLFSDDFEEFTLPIDTFLNGSNGDTLFEGIFGAHYPVVYDTVFDYWASGFAVSTMTNDSQGGFTDLYSSIALPEEGSHYLSVNLGQGPVRIDLSQIPYPLNQAMSLDVCNSTYAYFSMLEGDGFAKKFGGAAGTDPDYFVLKISQLDENDSLLAADEVYLADFRFTNSALDFILNEWQTVLLSELSNPDLVAAFELELFSSDTGMFGINTPLFLCIDNVKYAWPGAVEETEQGLSIEWIQEAMGFSIYTDIPTSLTITNMVGQVVLKRNIVDTYTSAGGGMESGAYLVEVMQGGRAESRVCVVP